MSVEDRHRAAIAQAVEIAARNRPPQTARSMTASENRVAQRREVGCLFDGGAMLLALMPFMLLLSGDLGFAWRVAPWCIGAAPLVWAIGWLLKRRAGRGYVDPKLVLEAGEDGLIVRRGDGTSVDYEYAALSAEVRPGAFERNPFLGIVLKAGSETIPLDNAHYKNGRTTGAAILARVRAAGGRVTPAED